MPRGARLDAPGTLHHVMIRGIERRTIVDDDKDRKDFVSRLTSFCLCKADVVDKQDEVW